MFPLPEAIIAVLVPFAPLFSRPVWVHVPVWVAGARLCRGPRTVAAVLRVVGLGEERRLARDHRVLSRARGSGLLAAKSLLGGLLPVLPESGTPIIPVDETLERRQGRRIQAKGDYRDAVRSTPPPGREVPGVEVDLHFSEHTVHDNREIMKNHPLTYHK